MKITIEDREIQHTEARILKTMDTGADFISVTFPWIAGEDPGFDSLVQPRAFPNFEAEIDGELLVSGKIYTPDSSLSIANSQLTLEGYSYTKDLVDSMAKPPYEDSKKSLIDIATKYCELFGIEALFGPAISQEMNEPFTEATIKNTERIFAYLQRLARQRGVLASSDEFGNLLFLIANITGVPVANITEGDLQGATQAAEEFRFRFDGTKTFNTYRATAQTPGSTIDPIVGLSKDSGVDSPRFLTFSADDSTKGGIQAAADWARNKALADSMEIKFPVVGFDVPASLVSIPQLPGVPTPSKIWRENTIATVISPTMFIPNGFDFLIRSVEYISTDAAETSVLDFVPPQLYTKGGIKLPW